jgi:replicative DNA helicase
MAVPLTSLNFALDTQQVVGFEKALLGTLLAYSNLFQKAEELLPSDFIDPGHQAIFSQMLALYRQDQLSARAVVENMRIREELNTEEMRFNGEGYIEELTTYASAPSVDNFIQNVIKASMRRQILNASALMAADANQYDIDPDEILDQTEERILQLRRRTSTEGIDAGNLMDMFETQMNARLDGSYVPALYPKIYALQELLGAYEDQDFPIVAARPGDGKSSYARWEAYKEAQAGRRVAIVNLENSETEYARWMVAMHTQIDAELLRQPRRLNVDQLQAVKDAIGDLRGMPLKIITLGSPSAQEVMRALLPEVRAGAKSMWVDYIQKMYNGDSNRVNDISVSSSLLRGFALKHHVVVGCGAQLSRSIIARGENAEPEQSDLRESGSLEQEATHILFPRKLWARPTDEDLRQFPENRDGRVKVIPVHFYIKKNRNGPEGVSGHVIWKKHINHYETVEAH